MQPSQEDKVVFYLQQKGIATYLPKTETYTYKGIKKFKNPKPLFPIYIFALCEKKKVYQVCCTKGVKRVLWENTKPQPTSEELIFSLNP